MARNELSKPEEQVARFVGGIRESLQDALNLHAFLVCIRSLSACFDHRKTTKQNQLEGWKFLLTADEELVL